jgi:hypothetical protein
MKPCDMLLIVVSRFPPSSSSHVTEPFDAHCGHVTGVTNRSRFTVAGSCPMLVQLSLLFVGLNLLSTAYEFEMEQDALS